MRKTLTVLTIAAGCAFAASAQATVVFQDGFESEPAGSALNYNAFANWDVLNGTVDKIASGDFSISCAGGAGLCVDMDGSTRNAGDLATKASFNVFTGETVRLMFDFSGNQRGGASDTMAVSLGGLFSETFSNVLPGQAFQTVTRTFVAAANENANLVFSHGGGDNVGMILDNVKLEVEPVSVPVPPTMLLMGSVLGLVAWKARRTRKA